MARRLHEVTEEVPGSHRTVEAMMSVGCCGECSMTASLNKPQKWIKTLSWLKEEDNAF
jgi:hypothetical protein